MTRNERRGLVVGFLGDKIAYETRRGWGVYSYQLLRALIEVEAEIQYRCFYSIRGRHRRAHVLKDDRSNLQNRIWPVPGRLMELVWEKWPVLSAEFFLGKIDVLHVPYEFLPAVRSARTVVTVHDVTFLKHPEGVDSSFVEQHRRRIGYVVEHADQIVAISQNTKEELVTLTGVPEERVVVIPNGVDDSFRPPEEMGEVAQLLRNFEISPPYVLYVGAADEDKNLVRLAKAFAQVRRQLPDLQLVLAGGDDLGYERLLKQLHGMHLEVGIVRVGFVPPRDLPLMYAGAEVLAMPSIHEGFGLPALEAMACGTAVVCSDVSSLPEVVGEAGVLVDPYSVDAIADGLGLLLRDDSLRARHRLLGLTRARQFSWRATAASVLDVYKGLVS